MNINLKFCLFILIMNFFLSGYIFSQNDSIMSLDAQGSFVLSGIDYSPDGLKIAAGYSLRIIIWDTITGNPIDTINNVEGPNLTVKYSHNGSMIVSSGQMAPQLWDAQTGELLKTFPGKPLPSWVFMIGASFSHDDKKIVGSSMDSTVAIWDVNTGELIRRFKAHDKVVQDATFSLDDSKIISCSFDSTIKIWDANSGKLLKTIKGHKDKIIRVVISPDGKKFASCGDSTIKLWDINTYELIRTFYGHKDDVMSIVFSPNGTKILSGCYDKTVKLWDVNSGELLHTFEHHNPVFCVRYSPDSLRIASAGLLEKIIIWKVPGITDVVEQIYLPEEDLIISPNPATDFIEINISSYNKSGSGGISVKVYDVLGMEVALFSRHSRESRNFGWSDEIPNQVGNDTQSFRIDISALAPGIYFVKIGSQITKFIKVK